MNIVFSALFRALRDLFHPKVLLLTLLPLSIAFLLWAALLYYCWGAFTLQLGQFLVYINPWPDFFNFNAAAVANVLVWIVTLFLILPLVYFTAVILTSIFAMPFLLKLVCGREYPGLQEMHGGSNFGSVYNGLAAGVVYLLGWLVILPLWLLPPVGFIASIVLTGYLNKRLFSYDALAGHASREERRALIQQYGQELWLLGVITALAQFIPLANLLAPIYAGLAYIHFSLDRLTALRSQGAIVKG
jgi:CysZ protein